MKFAVAVKRTKWERDLIRFGSEEETRKIYSLQDSAYDRVYGSHMRQIAALEQLKSALPHSDFFYREELEQLSELEKSRYDGLISLGGDNHFIYIAMFAGSMPLIGINSDPMTSQGALIYFHCDDFLESLERSRHKESPTQAFDIEHWSTIGCDLVYSDGTIVQTGPSISEISIRNDFPDAMSRYLIRIDTGDLEEQKSSGLLLATGAGSTGWYRNALPAEVLESGDATFSRDAAFFRAVAREAGHRGRSYKNAYNEVAEGHSLEVISEMEGIITIDCHPERSFPFPPGCLARFFLSQQRLNVVRKIN